MDMKLIWNIDLRCFVETVEKQNTITERSVILRFPEQQLLFRNIRLLNATIDQSESSIPEHHVGTLMQQAITRLHWFFIFYAIVQNACTFF